MDIESIKKVYISGIGGIGVSAIARFFIDRGVEVEGSDLVKSEVTEDLDRKGVRVHYEQKAENVTFNNDLFVYSSAVPAENEERQKAKELNLLQKSYFEMIGEISKKYNTIAVSGTNGKSTTTAMLAGILINAEKDPTVIVGSHYEMLGANFRAGKSNTFLVEACEYRAHMLLLQPNCIVLTNVEEDHLDFYKDINHIVQTFQQYINSLKNEDDILIYNNDDVHIREMQKPRCKKVSFGLIHGADVWANKIHKEPGKQVFEIVAYGQSLGQFELNIPGDINIYNALAAISYALSQDIPVGMIREGIQKYTGIWRRFEIVKNDKFTVVSDYAHHPTAVKSTIEATKEFFPGRRLIAVFQPHQQDRTQKMFDEFLTSFDKANIVVLSEIYDVTGREDSETKISSKDLVLAMGDEDPIKEIYYVNSLDDTLLKINNMVQEDDVVLIMGAGNIYKIADQIVLKEKAE